MTKTTDTIPPLSKTCPLSTSRLEAPDFEALRAGAAPPSPPRTRFIESSRSHPCPARLEARSGASPRRSKGSEGSEGWAGLEA